MACLGCNNAKIPFFDANVVHQDGSRPDSNVTISSLTSKDSTERCFNPADEIPNPWYHRNRRPALVPQTPSFSLAEAEELVRNRISQPLFPPPDAGLINRFASKSSDGDWHLSPSPSPNPELNDGLGYTSSDEERLLATVRSLFPTSSASDTRRRALWLKARAHYARDRNQRLQARAQCRTEAMPKRKHCAFLLDEELNFQLEDVVGTPHLSEIEPGDEVPTQFGIEDLRMDGPRAPDAHGPSSGPVSPKGANDKDTETYFQTIDET
ncbi:hypothetical protein AOQ84DRAFT_101704 [Glonium stellatum]|uniref:Uncharacterized protein n=1 Tax=Glonium stellatum TaxID=574774 RepID=A0A8E2EV42_9PEZI|nr:hypothetical protein AOQ84DRAFT_101704 [Glonium stellatum]